MLDVMAHVDVMLYLIQLRVRSGLNLRARTQRAKYTYHVPRADWLSTKLMLCQDEWMFGHHDLGINAQTSPKPPSIWSESYRLSEVTGRSDEMARHMGVLNSNVLPSVIRLQKPISLRRVAFCLCLRHAWVVFGACLVGKFVLSCSVVSVICLAHVWCVLWACTNCSGRVWCAFGTCQRAWAPYSVGQRSPAPARARQCLPALARAQQCSPALRGSYYLEPLFIRLHLWLCLMTVRTSVRVIFARCCLHEPWRNDGNTEHKECKSSQRGQMNFLF